MTPHFGCRPDYVGVVTGIVMALSRFVPLSGVPLHVQSLACYGALLPLAHSMWRQGEGTLNRRGPRQRMAETTR